MGRFCDGRGQRRRRDQPRGLPRRPPPGRGGARARPRSRHRGDMTKPLFDPVVKGNREAPNPAPLAEWRPIVPAPQDAPAPPAAHPKLGMPAFRWEYRDASEKLLGIVDRYETKDGKEVRPLVFAEHEKWGREWRWRGFPKPRPLYGLDRLAMRPDAPALVCEGEKSADAAGRLLPDFVAVTSPGGSKAAKDADWSVLAGREVVIWRDADAPGEAYMRRVLDMLGKLSPAPAVKAATPPEGVPLGWDAADALAEGWDTARAAALIRAAELAPDDETAARPRKPNTRDWLLGLIEEDAELWHDRERVAYASVTVDDHRENHEIASRGFRGWLARRAYQATGDSPAREAHEAAPRGTGPP